jgi:Fe-S-cluster containining protein
MLALFMRHRVPSRDSELIQIVDVALADAARKAGEWLVCRRGCTQCCIGAFAINALDAARLRSGIVELQRGDPHRAERVRKRAQEYLRKVSDDFPGDFHTGFLDDSEEGQRPFAEFANDEACPALDLQTGSCDLYEFRPMTCRVFGPAIRDADGNLGACELCFQGATDQQIAACEMTPDPGRLEDSLLADLGDSRQTIVAFVLAETAEFKATPRMRS